MAKVVVEYFDIWKQLIPEKRRLLFLCCCRDFSMPVNVSWARRNSAIPDTADIKKYLYSIKQLARKNSKCENKEGMAGCTETEIVLFC